MTNNDNPFLPIRVVQSSRNFLIKKRSRGGEPEIFLNEEELVVHRRKLETEISDIDTALASDFQRFPNIPNVIKARLRDDALAKSYRPRGILNDDTCPIIGLNDIGELLLSSTKKGLGNLKQRVAFAENLKEKANISVVEDFHRYSEEDKLSGLSFATLMEKARENGEMHLKVILFDHHKDEMNTQIIREFMEYLNQIQVKADLVSNIEKFNIWRVKVHQLEQVSKIIAHPLVRTVSFFPAFTFILPKGIVQNKEIRTFPQLVTGREYPVVVLVDTGISPKNKHLEPWVIDKEVLVPPDYQDNNHGTFVAGLLSMPNQLNNDNISPDDEHVQIIDVLMIPDPSKDALSEDLIIERFLEIIPRIISKHKNAKIWNMSAGFSVNVEDEKFSSFSMFLDKLQDEYDIIFVLPSGNYENFNQRKWPPQEDIGETDRLQVPGDSVRAITVGALAYKEVNNSIVRMKEPASYSRRGPGPMSLIKPELVHYSGNLAINENGLVTTNQGIISFNENGELLEDAGTSFSCPLISRSIAILHGSLANTVSNSLLRALTVHNSHIPDTITDRELALPYVGFGMPSKVEDFLSCTRNSITLVFENEIIERHTIEYPFPWPHSLTDSSGRCRGVVRMTLVAETPLDKDYGSEYIRAKIEASLSSRILSPENNSSDWTSRLKEYTFEPDPKKNNEEKLRVAGQKWTPIKRYEGNMKRINANDWKIGVRITLRDGFSLNGSPVKFALIFSLTDPEGIAPVYDEVTLELKNMGVITEPIKVRNIVKERVGVGG